MTIETATRRVMVQNTDGLHLRAAAMLAQTASEFHSDIRVVCRNRAADAKSIMDLLTLVAEKGCELDLEARGPDSCMAINAMADLVLSGFRNSFERSQA
jgi:phosphotransferase system HPr (HPr) family protein